MLLVGIALITGHTRVYYSSYTNSVTKFVLLNISTHPSHHSSHFSSWDNGIIGIAKVIIAELDIKLTDSTEMDVELYIIRPTLSSQNLELFKCCTSAFLPKCIDDIAL